MRLTSQAEERFGVYSCQDSAASAECMRRLDEELNSKGYRQQYDDTIRLYRPLLAMMLRGIRTDAEKIEEVKREITRKIADTQAELDTLCSRAINVNSFRQMSQYFYIEKGIKPLLNREGKPSCDDKALARLAKGTKTRPPFREAFLVQTIRGLLKLESTYLSIRFDGDGRFRCSYNPRGTTTGRLSSSKTLFDTGMNHQNLPQEYKQFLVPDPGYFFIEEDKAQAEWVIVAYVSGDPRMIAVVESGADPHIETGHSITGVDRDTIIQEDRLVGHETDPEIIAEIREAHLPELVEAASRNIIYLPRSMGIRQVGKKSNHGLNYGMGYIVFAMEYEIPVSEAKILAIKYHQTYPGIENGFWEMVKQQLSKDRTLTNCFGERRQFLDVWGSKLLKKGYDYIPQSTVAKVIKEAMINVYEDTDPITADLEMLAQVHDSVLHQHPLTCPEHTLKILLKLQEYSDFQLEWTGRKFRIESDFRLGLENWRDMQKVKVDLASLRTAFSNFENSG